jgi:hypothetical protein
MTANSPMGNFSGIGVSRATGLFILKPQFIGNDIFLAFGILFSQARHELEMEFGDEMKKLKINEQAKSDEDEEKAEDNEGIVK